MRRETMLLLLFCGTTATRPILSQEVLVKAAEMGQGVSRTRGAECVVLTAGHVAPSGASGTVLGQGGVSAPATVTRTYPDDVSILVVNAGASFPCGPWRVPDTVAVILHSATTGYLRLRTQAASLSQIPVSILAHNDRFLTIAPASGLQIHKTMSGSPLYAGGEMIGLLLSVNVEAGRGHVFRVDALNDLVRSFFNNRDPPPGPTPLPQPDVPGFRVVTLRSKPDDPSDGNVRKMLQRLDLFDVKLNPSGRGVANQYHRLSVPIPMIGLSTRNLGDSLGAQVTQVDSGPSRQAGIVPGDFIVTFDGTPVKATNHLSSLVRKTESGRVVAIRLLRNNAPLTLRVVVGIRNESVVIDFATGLMWGAASQSALSFADAEWFVKQWNYLGYAGHNNWRLPTLEESLSLMEPFVAQRSYLKEGIFPRTYGGVWTSDDCQGARWIVDYQAGGLRCALKGHLNTAMIVR